MNSYEHTSREFLPLSVIRSACAGDPDAVEQVLRHYRGYIIKLCTGIFYDKGCQNFTENHNSLNKFCSITEVTSTSSVQAFSMTSTVSLMCA